MQSIQKFLASEGVSLKDGRGKHSNTPHKITNETYGHVLDCIKSLCGRKSHYANRDTDKIYVSETLNIAKLSRIYNELLPGNKLSYETFRMIFKSEFNISFGYPMRHLQHL